MPKTVKIKQFYITQDTFGKGEGAETVSINLKCDKDQLSVKYSSVKTGGKQNPDDNTQAEKEIVCGGDILVSIDSVVEGKGDLTSRSEPISTKEIRCFYDNNLTYRFTLPVGQPSEGSTFTGNEKCLSNDSVEDSSKKSSVSDSSSIMNNISDGSSVQDNINSLVPTTLPPCCPSESRRYEVELNISDKNVAKKIDSVLLSLNEVGGLYILPNSSLSALLSDNGNYPSVCKLTTDAPKNQKCGSDSVADSLKASNLNTLCRPNGEFSISISGLGKGASYSTKTPLKCDDYINDYSTSGKIEKPVLLYNVDDKGITFDSGYEVTLNANKIYMSYIPYPIYEGEDRSCSVTTRIVFPEQPKCSIAQKGIIASSKTIYNDFKNINKANVVNSETCDSDLRTCNENVSRLEIMQCDTNTKKCIDDNLMTYDPSKYVPCDNNTGNPLVQNIINNTCSTNKVTLAFAVIGGIFTAAAITGILYHYKCCCFNPIGISLEGDKEIKLVSLKDSTVFFKYFDNQNPMRTSWVDKNDAILVYDHNQNSIVDDGKEIVMTTWCKQAKTDFEALLCAFDSNKDMIFDKNDVEFKNFYLWQDKNQNGISEAEELTSLKQAGLQSINFNTQQEVLNNPDILNTAEVHWDNGMLTQAYDLVFYHEYAKEEAITG